MMRNLWIASIVLGGTLSSLFLPVKAQQSGASVKTTSTLSAAAKDVYFVNRAKNLARQAAIKANGGLEKYRPDPIMYGPAVQTTYTENPDGSVTFKFMGGTPGAAPSIETVATVRPDGIVTLDYNGSIRNANTTGSTANSTAPGQSSSNTTIAPAPQPKTTQANTASSWADEDSFLTRARNLARQAAINANGGLEKYRPESVMFGPAAKSPHIKNPDGSLTFTFKGSVPGAAQLTLESVINVSRNGAVAVQYNGPTRSP